MRGEGRRDRSAANGDNLVVGGGFGLGRSRNFVVLDGGEWSCCRSSGADPSDGALDRDGKGQGVRRLRPLPSGHLGLGRRRPPHEARSTVGCDPAGDARHRRYDDLLRRRAREGRTARLHLGLLRRLGSSRRDGTCCSSPDIAAACRRKALTRWQPRAAVSSSAGTSPERAGLSATTSRRSMLEPGSCGAGRRIRCR